MSEIDDLIQRLDAWLQENRPEYYASLNPGATDEEIAELETVLGYKLPEDFVAFYKWKNGSTSHSIVEEVLYNAWEFLSIKNILYYWNIVNEAILNDDYFLKNWWSKYWVPFLGYNGDFICIDINGVFDNIPNQILAHSHEDPDRAILHCSFSKWLESLVAATENPYFVDGIFEGMELSVSEYQRINPGYSKTFYAGENPTEDPREWK